MVWKTLAESLESALASMMNDDGLEGGGTPSDAVKSSKRGTGAVESPGQVVVREVKQREKPTEATQPGKAPASLGNAKGRRAHPHELAPLGARQPLVLVVDNGPHFRLPRLGTPDLRAVLNS